MAHFIIHRPAAHCHPSEIRVAEVLRDLDDRWTVIWGYFYEDKRGHTREGDFLVLGPAGGMMVLEVKNRVPRWFSDTGQWEGESTSPVDQLMNEWSSVRDLLKRKRIRLWLTKALCVPTEVASREAENYQGIPRQLLVLRNDLDHWVRTWCDHFGEKVGIPVMPDTRDAVLALFGASVRPGERRVFLDHTEQLFQRQLGTRFALLDQLRDNRQLIVRGGTGTGKTWHAFEQAIRYASADGGKEVLLLVYNLALTSHLERQIALRKLERGRVTVMSWEKLFLTLAEAVGRLPEQPRRSDKAASELYYDVTLPALVLEASRNHSALARWPKFDALVVDEAQDHDTAWHSEIPTRAGETGGWWHIYQLLLHDGRKSAASIFHDPAQRPPFRDGSRFDFAVLASCWSQPAYLTLHPAVRYTRPIWSYLNSVDHEFIRPLVEGLGRGDHLPEGPEPETLSYTDPGELPALLESIIQRWHKRGFCQPEEVLILHKSSDLSKTPLKDHRVLYGRNLREVSDPDATPDSIRHTSINKAKGLDARAVILIGLPPLTKPTKDLAYNWFMGASRARQLLAVVELV